MNIPAKDKTILRELGHTLAEIGNLPVQKSTAGLWRQLNGLHRTRPLVWINEIPWWEMNAGGELTVRCTEPFCKLLETWLRQTIYQWNHLRGDMVVDPWIECLPVIHDTGFGVQRNRVASGEGLVAADFVPVIQTDADIDAIQMPTVTFDRQATEENYQAMCHLFDGIVPVKKVGISTIWHAPWDDLIQWWGITELYTDLVDRPAFVHHGIDRMTHVLLHRLDQYEKQGLLYVGNNNHRVGSGGLGITDELPAKDYDGVHARPIDLWGTSTGQIFSGVGPEMHEEFCLRYELKWLEKFGLNCYGCCEPLHNKIHLMRTIPRLRRISVSPLADKAVASERIGRDYVYSAKPNPAVLATDRWRPQVAREELQQTLDLTRGNVVEVILKDVSTVRDDPRRLWEWADLAMDLVREYA